MPSQFEGQPRIHPCRNFFWLFTALTITVFTEIILQIKCISRTHYEI